MTTKFNLWTQEIILDPLSGKTTQDQLMVVQSVLEMLKAEIAKPNFHGKEHLLFFSGHELSVLMMDDYVSGNGNQTLRDRLLAISSICGVMRWFTKYNQNQLFAVRQR